MLDRNSPSEFNCVSADPQLNRIVWMFGGATVRGNAHWDPNQTLPALLSKFLNQRGKPYHFTVVNFGENGFNSLLEAKYLQKVLAESQESPHVVIFYDGGNDCFQYVQHREPEGHVGYRRLKAFIEGYRMILWGIFKPVSAAIDASYTNEFIDRIHIFSDPVKPDSQTLDHMVALTAKRFDHVAKVVHCYKAEFLLVWQHMLWVEDCQIGEAVKRAERSMFVDSQKFPDLKQSLNTTYNKFERELRNKPYFVSLRNVLCERKVAFFQPDGIHVTSEGDEVIARNIGKLLINRFPRTLVPQATGDADKSSLGNVQ